jgi:hypothetical protein
MTCAKSTIDPRLEAISVFLKIGESLPPDRPLPMLFASIQVELCYNAKTDDYWTDNQIVQCYRSTKQLMDQRFPHAHMGWTILAPEFSCSRYVPDQKRTKVTIIPKAVNDDTCIDQDLVNVHLTLKFAVKNDIPLTVCLDCDGRRHPGKPITDVKWDMLDLKDLAWIVHQCPLLANFMSVVLSRRVRACFPFLHNRNPSNTDLVQHLLCYPESLEWIPKWQYRNVVHTHVANVLHEYAQLPVSFWHHMVIEYATWRGDGRFEE